MGFYIDGAPGLVNIGNVSHGQYSQLGMNMEKPFKLVQTTCGNTVRFLEPETN